MGVSMAWVGIRDPSREQTLARLGLEPTGEKWDMLPSRDGPPYTDQAGANGWHIIVGRGCDNVLISDAILRMLSDETDVIACAIEEHVMYASLARWSDGKRVWNLTHYGCSNGPELITDGALPFDFQSYIARVEEVFPRDEDSSHYPLDYVFTAMTEIAKEITGFTYDEELPDFVFEGYELLSLSGASPLAVTPDPVRPRPGVRRPAPASRPWWKSWG